MLSGSDSQVDLLPCLLVGSRLSSKSPQFRLHAQHAVNHPEGQLPCSTHIHQWPACFAFWKHKKPYDAFNRLPMWLKFPAKAKSKLRVQAGPVGPRRGVRVWASVSCWPGAFATYRYSSTAQNKYKIHVVSILGWEWGKIISEKCICTFGCGIFMQIPTLAPDAGVSPAWAALGVEEVPCREMGKVSFRETPAYAGKRKMKWKRRADAPHLASSSLFWQSGLKSQILSGSVHGLSGGLGNFDLGFSPVWEGRKKGKKKENTDSSRKRLRGYVETFFKLIKGCYQMIFGSQETNECRRWQYLRRQNPWLLPLLQSATTQKC